MSAARRSLALCVGCVAVSSAFADDPPPAPKSNDDAPKLEGDVRVGWRFIAGEDEGRFPQDQGLEDGLRVFELNVFGTRPRADGAVDSLEGHFSGIGDPYSDYLLSVRRPRDLDLDVGYRRDDYDYRATGDPFPYETLRERRFADGTWTPSRDVSLAVRFGWDENDRRGDADTRGNGLFTGSSLAQQRDFTTETDRFHLGADYAFGIGGNDSVRFGVTETIGLNDIEDARSSSGAETDATLREVRSKSYSTAAKAGASLLDGGLDATLFFTDTQMPLEERTTGTMTDTQGNSYVLDGDGELRREAVNWRFETIWRPLRDWEVTAAGESDDVIDEERGSFSVGPNPQSTPFARVTDRSRRLSLDLAWQATKEVRLRAGEQYLHEELFVPTDSHFNVPDAFKRNRPTDISTDAWRTTVGADWETLEGKLSLSALAHFSNEDEPQTTTVPDHQTDWTFRGRWKATKELSFATVWRSQVLGHTGALRLYEVNQRPDTSLGQHPGQTVDLDSSTRSNNFSESFTWARGGVSVRGTVTYQRFDTRTDSAYFGAGTRVFEGVSFSGRNVVASLDVSHEFLDKRLRVFADATRTTSNGDVSARWFQFAIGAEYALLADANGRDTVVLGLTVSSWRLSDDDFPADDYSTHAVELSTTYRF